LRYIKFQLLNHRKYLVPSERYPESVVGGKTNTLYYENHIIFNNIKQTTGILTLNLLLYTVTTKI